jgi:cytochrome c-type biogenesis protein CcmH
MNKIATFFILALIWSGAQAIDPRSFDNPEDEARYQELIEELRCLVCQNQNIADSSAPLAKDLRSQVLEMINEGKSDAQIKTFMTDRYGDFVLYAPPVKSSTWVLWFGPAAILAGGMVFFIVTLRRRMSLASEALADPDQEELDRRIEQLEKENQ